MKTHKTIPDYLKEPNPHKFATKEYWDWEKKNKWDKFTKIIVFVYIDEQKGTQGWVSTEISLVSFAKYLNGNSYWFYLDDALNQKEDVNAENDDKIKAITQLFKDKIYQLESTIANYEDKLNLIKSLSTIKQDNN